MDTLYRIENIEDSFGCIEYYLTYLLITTRFFGLVKNENWVTIPIATDARALGVDPMIRKDCVCQSTIGELKKFTIQYPDVNVYLNDVYIPILNQLVNKWVEVKAEDEDAFDTMLESKGYAFIN
jgi:hypothetical protein